MRGSHKNVLTDDYSAAFYISGRIGRFAKLRLRMLLISIEQSAVFTELPEYSGDRLSIIEIRAMIVGIKFNYN